MRRSRIVAALAIGPLVIALAWLVANDPILRWLEREPVVVVEGAVGSSHTVGGAIFTVEGASVAAPGSDAAGYADAPDASQVVVVDLRVDDATDPTAWCTYRLEATVGGERMRWTADYGASDVTGCYAEEGSLSGAVGFVVPEGPIEDARLLVGGSTLWIGVPLSL